MRHDESWHRLKGRLRERWSGLTDEDAEAGRGDRDALVGRLHALSGAERAELERDLDSLSRETQFVW